jgi:alkanesulfonate monooxygenase SsuD/methylene tetrahydromethanopterin reductase-like flavin-dependent oxidoreductase (luciferase family)
MIPYSLLDLVPILDGGTAGQALANAADLAAHAETLGFTRYWVAEHHGMPGIASAATSVVIGHLAAATNTIRVGAGGIMLPNHAPMVIAEQFGTLDALFPGRIDLGLGRAPGSDQRVARALRRTLETDPNAFPQDVMELQSLFAGDGQPAALRLRREAALRALEFFHGFQPRLVGPVLDGTADAHAPVALHLHSDDADAVGRWLEEHGVPAQARVRQVRLDRERAGDFPVWVFSAEDLPFDLTVLPADVLRQAPLSPVDGKPMRRASASQLRELLAQDEIAGYESS